VPRAQAAGRHRALGGTPADPGEMFEQRQQSLTQRGTGHDHGQRITLEPLFAYDE
jgi:hypothetical protein